MEARNIDVSTYFSSNARELRRAKQMLENSLYAIRE